MIEINADEFNKLKICPNPECCSSGIFFLFSCPDRLTNSPGEFSVYKCKNCGFVFQNPRINLECQETYHPKKIWHSISNIESLLKTNQNNSLKDFFKKQALINHFNYSFAKKNIFYFFLSWPFRRILKTFCFPNFQQGGKLLEIGCSNGYFLKEMQNLGWETKGVEPDQESSFVASNSCGLCVENKKIENCNFKESEFDAIVARMVLAHLYNPFETLQTITSWLKKDGQLIFSIPYFFGVEFKWFKNFCYGLQLPTMISFFSKKMLRDNLKKIGYDQIKFYHHYFDRDIVASANYKYQATGKLFYKLLSENKSVRLLIIRPLSVILGVMGLTSRVSVYATLLKK
ncbi:MAG: class I SAM-dependent methyltransferase [Candidatus Pacebacteria bacterium]|nr:class I SAM-dependent methyltransferase [Candidatus Paceibacterota bacterium]